jgi:hypothetical protein
VLYTPVNMLILLCQAALSPITPLEGEVEMFSRGKPQPVFSIDTQFANRRSQLSIVPELDTPATFLEAPGHHHSEKARPISEITEIFDENDEDLSEFEEDSEGLSFDSVSDSGWSTICAQNTDNQSERGEAKPDHHF